MKAEHLEREFAVRGVRYREGEILLRPSDAIELVARAADEGVPIVTVDERRVTEDVDASQSAPRRVADFSKRVAEGHGCWEEAEAVIRRHGAPDAVFALQLGDDPIEVV